MAFWKLKPDTAHAVANAILASGDALKFVKIEVDHEQEDRPMTFTLIEKGDGPDGAEKRGATTFNDTYLCPPRCQ